MLKSLSKGYLSTYTTGPQNVPIPTGEIPVLGIMVQSVTNLSGNTVSSPSRWAVSNPSSGTVLNIVHSEVLDASHTDTF